MQTGGFVYQVNGTTKAAVSAGTHWFVTAGRSAFYLGYDRMLLSTSTVNLTPTLQATFADAQRFQGLLYAMPTVGNMNFFAGGGFSIVDVTDAAPTGAFATPDALAAAQDEVNKAKTRAFAVLAGGVQYRVRDRIVVFGNYQFLPWARDFIISSDQHSIMGGLRYAIAGLEQP